MSEFKITEEKLEDLHEGLFNMGNALFKATEEIKEIIQDIIKYALDEEWDAVRDLSQRLTVEATTVCCLEEYSSLIYKIDVNCIETADDDDELDDEFDNKLPWEE